MQQLSLIKSSAKKPKATKNRKYPTMNQGQCKNSINATAAQHKTAAKLKLHFALKIQFCIWWGALVVKKKKKNTHKPRYIRKNALTFEWLLIFLLHIKWAEIDSIMPMPHRFCISGWENAGALFLGKYEIYSMSKSIHSKKIKLLPYWVSYYSYFPPTCTLASTDRFFLGRVSVSVLVINRCECKNLWDFHGFLKPSAKLCGLSTGIGIEVRGKPKKCTRGDYVPTDHISIKVTVTTKSCDN